VLLNGFYNICTCQDDGVAGSETESCCCWLACKFARPAFIICSFVCGLRSTRFSHARMVDNPHEVYGWQLHPLCTRSSWDRQPDCLELVLSRQVCLSFGMLGGKESLLTNAVAPLVLICANRRCDPQLMAYQASCH
jgi:hypothetical protein